jgi:hypothetical protein
MRNTSMFLFHNSDDYDFAREVLQGISEVTDVDEYIGKRKEMKFGKGERLKKKKMRDFSEDEVTQARALLPNVPEDSSEEGNFNWPFNFEMNQNENIGSFMLFIIGFICRNGSPSYS